MVHSPPFERGTSPACLHQGLVTEIMLIMTTLLVPNFSSRIVIISLCCKVSRCCTRCVYLAGILSLKLIPTSTSGLPGTATSLLKSLLNWAKSHSIPENLGQEIFLTFTTSLEIVTSGVTGFDAASMYCLVFDLQYVWFKVGVINRASCHCYQRSTPARWISWVLCNHSTIYNGLNFNKGDKTSVCNFISWF